MTLDVDDDGRVLYRFPSVHWGKLRVAPGPVRVDASGGAWIDGRHERSAVEADELELDAAGPPPKASRA